jgi:hypothetical protein
MRRGDVHFKSATIIAITMLAQGGPAGTQFGIASGEWQVTEVLVDRQATRTLGYGPNDPRLRYRIATIGAGRVTFDSPERAVCEQPAWSEDEISIGALWRSSFGGRGTAPEWPTAQDYGLSIAIDQKVSRVSVHCKDGGFGPLAGNEPKYMVYPFE